MKVYFHDSTPAAPGEKHGERGPTHCITTTVDYEYQVEQHVIEAAKDFPHVVRIECPDVGREWLREGSNFREKAKNQMELSTDTCKQVLKHLTNLTDLPSTCLVLVTNLAEMDRSAKEELIEALQASLDKSSKFMKQPKHLAADFLGDLPGYAPTHLDFEAAVTKLAELLERVQSPVPLAKPSDGPCPLVEYHNSLSQCAECGFDPLNPP